MQPDEPTKKIERCRGIEISKPEHLVSHRGVIEPVASINGQPVEEQGQRVVFVSPGNQDSDCPWRGDIGQHAHDDTDTHIPIRNIVVGCPIEQPGHADTECHELPGSEQLDLHEAVILPWAPQVAHFHFLDC
jgi:hypothetical protein